ncbi:hypothetical protein C0J52_10840 [Blattella germanica]|nr:hypothetical protein C0J52_10840 [Blattella germanica]
MLNTSKTLCQIRLQKPGVDYKNKQAERDHCDVMSSIIRRRGCHWANEKSEWAGLVQCPPRDWLALGHFLLLSGLVPTGFHRLLSERLQIQAKSTSIPELKPAEES